MTAPLQPHDEDASAEAGLAGSQAEGHAVQSGHERVSKPRRRRIRRSVVAVLVALSCLLVLLSTTVVWAHRTLLNTDTFVGTVSPVFKDPAVASAVATRATDQLFTELDLQARLRASLPPKVSFAAAPITNATEGYVASKLTSVLANPKFQDAWIAALTFMHRNLVEVLRGQRTAAISTSDGYIVLNTVPVINQALGKVSGLASDLTGKNVTLPTITSADPPQQAVNKLSKALGVQLPSNFGEITLVRSSDLGSIRQLVKAFDGLTLILPLVTIVLIALTLWLSVNRRRTALQLAVGVSLLMIVERRSVLHEQGVLASAAHNPQVAHSVLGSLLHGFFVLTAWVLVRYRFPGRRLLDAMVDLPFALPTAVSGIALTAIFSPAGPLGIFLTHIGWPVAYTPAGVTVAMVFIGLPFVVRTLQPAFEDLASELEDAAASLGANSWQVMSKVVLPLTLPSLITGFSLALARGIGEYGSIVFISGNLPFRTEITSLLIITKLEEFDYTGAAVIAMVMLVASFTLLFAINLLQKRSLHWLAKGAA